MRPNRKTVYMLVTQTSISIDDIRKKQTTTVEFVDNVPSKKMHTASIVYDAVGKVVIKNRWGKFGHLDDIDKKTRDLIKGYTEKYKTKIALAILKTL